MTNEAVSQADETVLVAAIRALDSAVALSLGPRYICAETPSGWVREISWGDLRKRRTYNKRPSYGLLRRPSAVDPRCSVPPTRELVAILRARVLAAGRGVVSESPRARMWAREPRTAL